jgi:hypothetical protein
MKKLLHEVKDLTGETYQLYAELVECAAPENFKQLSFYSVWLGTKHPKSQQFKCEFLLGAEALDNLKQLLETKK